MKEKRGSTASRGQEEGPETLAGTERLLAEAEQAWEQELAEERRRGALER